MNKGNKGTTRVFKLLLIATALFAFGATTFAGTLIPLVPNSDVASNRSTVGSGNPRGNLQVVDPDGTWIFNTNSTAAPWSTTANWSGGIIADGGGFADFSTVNITGARNPDIDTTSRTVRRLDIGDTNNTHSYTISASGGASLIFDNTANSADAQLNQTLNSHGDTISAPITLNSSLDVTNASSNTLTLSGIISGLGGLNLASGTLALGSSSNTYSGGTNISGGKITIGASGTPLGSSTLTLSGGSLVTTASRSSGSALTMNVVVTGDSAITTTSAASPVTLPFTGTLTGTGGTLTIRNDAVATTGQFDVRFSGGDYTMSQPIVIDNGAGGGSARFSDFNVSGTTHIYSGVISGTGSFNRSVSSGTGGLTVFTASNTYTGATVINSGTLQLGMGGTTGSISPSSAISIGVAGTFRIDRSDAIVQGTAFSSSAITGLGKFVKDGTGSVEFNITNSFSGGSTINKGTVIMSADLALGTGSISLTAGSITLTLQGAHNNFISDAATLSYVNTDAINLNYSGTDTVAGLIVDGVSQGPGVYGATGINPDGVFTGIGTITVVPEPTTVAMTLLGAGLLLGAQRFRRKAR